MLVSYGDDAGLKLNVFPARPRSISCPHAFIDATTETVVFNGPSPSNLQRTPTMEVVVLWGLFDSAEAVAQRDKFVDGFLGWVADRAHAINPTTLVEIPQIVDEPTFTADWARDGQQGPYFATRFLVGGAAFG